MPLCLAREKHSSRHMANNKQNPMRNLKIEKLTLNIGAGKDQAKLDKGMKLLKNITGVQPLKNVTQKRIQAWGLRPGLPVGTKITLRGEKARELLDRLLQAKEKKLKATNFDEEGNVAFGIHEYIDVPGIKYDPEIGITGFQACVTLERPGYKLKKRRLRHMPIPKRHRITKQDAIEFMQKEFNLKLAGDE